MQNGESRILDDKLAEIVLPEIDKRILNPFYRKNPKLVMINAALILSDKEVCEQGGDNKGSWVEMLQNTIGKPYGEPWCMSLQQTLIALAEKYTGIQSDIFGSEHCLTVAKNSRPNFISTPARGCMVIWKYGETQNGHTGLILSVSGSSLITFEGNTGKETGGINRDGDCALTKKRSTVGYGSARVFTFLDPFPGYSANPLNA